MRYGKKTAVIVTRTVSGNRRRKASGRMSASVSPTQMAVAGGS